MRRTVRDVRRRTLAQNFLVDAAAIDALVSAVAPAGRDVVLDAGAGTGALTGVLAARAGAVVAVERDPDWARELRRRAAAWRNVEVVEGDALAAPLPPPPFKVVANPPFAIGTALVRRLLGEGHGLEAAAVVLQREAARRLAGGGRFGATWAPWYVLRVARPLPARAFRPVPRVAASILLVEQRRPALLTPAAFAAHVALVDAVFAGRGETLGRRLAGVVGARRAARMLASAALDGSAGVGRVPPEAWAHLTRAR